MQGKVRQRKAIDILQGRVKQGMTEQGRTREGKEGREEEEKGGKR